MASAKSGTGHMVVVASGPDGTYVIDKLPEGTHNLNANRMTNFQMVSASREITITAGTRTTADLDFPVGTASLQVVVKGEGGKKIDAAQNFLFRGATTASNAKELTDRFLAGGAAGMVFWFGTPEFPKFEKLVAGNYTVCVLPINGNLADPQFGRRLQDHLDILKVYCKAVNVTEQPSEQTFTATVPQMTKLPE